MRVLLFFAVLYPAGSPPLVTKASIHSAGGGGLYNMKKDFASMLPWGKVAAVSWDGENNSSLPPLESPREEAEGRSEGSSHFRLKRHLLEPADWNDDAGIGNSIAAIRSSLGPALTRASVDPSQDFIL